MLAQQMYLFLLEEIAQKPKRDASELPVILKNLLAEFSGELRDIADGLHPTSHIVYRPLEAHLLKAPWHIGCIALVGDAAHATTPQLASGAAMAMEDGIVLAQEFVGAKTVHEAFERYFLRRYERCKMVVENSLKIGQLEVARASAVEQASVVETSLRHLAQPY
jgi:2-polyprenyl-6-methoxyphenol hydroxylase-like FAD-dependent oxidoreductase